MGLSTEVWIAGAYGLIVLLAAIGQYLSRRKQPPPREDAYVAAASLGFIEKDLARRLVEAAEGIDASVKVLADRERTEMQDTLNDIKDALSRKWPP